MRRILLLTVLFLACNVAYAQSADEQRQVLQKQISTNLMSGRVDLVIEPAAKLAELEKGLGDANIANYALALSNLAQWKKQLSIPYGDRSAETGTTSTRVASRKSVPREVREHFAELVQIYRSRIDDPSQLSSALLEAGDFRCEFPDPKDDPTTLPQQLREAVAIRAKITAPDSVAMINALSKLSRCEFEVGNFDEFLRTHKQLIPAIESRFGKDSLRLLLPLERYERLLVLTDRGAEAAEIVKRISSIAGVEYGVSEPDDLILKLSVGKVRQLFGRPSQALFGVRQVTVPNPMTPNRNDTFTATTSRTGSTIVTTIPGNRTTTGNLVVDQGGRTTIYQRRNIIISIEVDVVVDETGAVIKATAVTDNEKYKAKAERKAMEWKFRPLVIDGVGQRMIGRIFIDWGI